MAIEKSVSNEFLFTFVDSINVFDCRLPGVIMSQSQYSNLNSFFASGDLYLLITFAKSLNPDRD